MDSTIAVPPRRLPMDSVSRVRIVTSEARSTLFTSVVENGIPLAFAPVT